MIASSRSFAERLEPRLLLANVTWDGGGGDGLWTTPANWSTDVRPAEGDDVFITGSSDEPDDLLVTLNGGPFTVNSLTCSRSTLRVLAPANLTVAAQALFDRAVFFLRGGVVQGGAITVSGIGSKLQWNAGTMAGPGTTTVVEALASVEGTAVKNLNRPLRLQRTSLTVGGGDVLLNNATITIEETASATFDAVRIRDNSGVNKLRNDGHLVIGGSAVGTLVEVPYEQDGALGTLFTQGRFTLAGGGGIVNTGAVRRGGGGPPVVIQPDAQLRLQAIDDVRYDFTGGISGDLGEPGGTLLIENVPADIAGTVDLRHISATGANAIAAVAGDTTLNGVTVEGGARLRFDGALRVNQTVEVKADGSRLDLSGSISIATLDLDDTNAVGSNVPTVRVISSSDTSVGGSSVLRVQSLLIGPPEAPVGRVDLMNNTMLLPQESELSARLLIKSGHSGGTWNGNGITSGTADRGAPKFALGYGLASGFGVGVIIQFTRYGDANLDAQVNLADFNILANNENFGQSNRFWQNGDFNYDGLVNLADFNLFASNFGANLPPPVEFGARQTFATGRLPHTAIAQDLNSDGRPELIAANQGEGPNPSTVSIFVNTPAGAGFLAKQDFTVGLLPVSVATGDYNDDGKVDLAVANAGSNSLSVLFNNTLPGATTLSFAAPVSLPTGSRPRFVAAGDFNGDGELDLASANFFANSVSVFLNSAANPGTFTPLGPDIQVGDGPLGLAVGDFNGDTRTDLVAVNQNSSNVAVLLGTGTPAVFAPPRHFSTGSGPRFVAAGDLDNDGRIDLVTADELDDTISVLRNTTTPGAATVRFAVRREFAVGSQPISVSIGQLDADNRPDVAVANIDSDNVSLLLNTTAPGSGLTTFAALPAVSVGRLPIFVSIADLNEDGQNDLAVANFSDDDTLSVLLNTTDDAALAPAIDKGHQILIDRGLQIQAQSYPPATFSLGRFQEANFTTVNWQASATQMSLLGPAPGVPWGRWALNTADTLLTPQQLPYESNFVSYQFLDERDFNIPQERANAAAWFATVRPRFPSTLLFTDQGTHVNPYSLPSVRLYVAESNPDMLLFNNYTFTDVGPVGGSPTELYGHMQVFRTLGLGDTSLAPRPYGMYVQTFASVEQNKTFRAPSDSEMRLNQFAAWTFGYKFVSAFMFNDVFSTLFVNGNPNQPTPRFFEIKETNRQSRNLGPALVRLKSTDVRFINGRRGAGKLNPTPPGVLQWAAGASDPYITNITATNLGSANNGLAGDVLVGYFNVLDEDFDGTEHTGEQYFMLTNGLSAATALAGETRQRLIVDFDFAASGITRLQRLSRTSGLVEPVPLLPLGGSRYRLELDLDGGTGDLFKFDTGAPFVPDTAAGGAVGDGGMTARAQSTRSSPSGVAVGAPSPFASDRAIAGSGSPFLRDAFDDGSQQRLIDDVEHLV